MKKVVLSAVSAFLYTFFGSLAVGVYLLKKHGETLDPMTLIGCFSLGIVSSIKDIRSSLRMSPLSNGNAEALDRLMKLIKNETKDENHE
jgi:hypothetical protein